MRERERGQTGEMRAGEPERRPMPQPLRISRALCVLHLTDAFPCMADLTAQAENKQDNQGCSHEEALHAGLLHFLFLVGVEGVV